MTWGSPIEIERRRRIRVAVWAYAYEKLSESLVADATFDSECKLVDLKIKTGTKRMDDWFRANFQPFTGQWVHTHPDQPGLERIAQSIIKNRSLLCGDTTAPTTAPLVQSSASTQRH